MPFATVESVGERDALIKKFLKNRETLRKRVVDEKVGKQTFQREVAAELQKPVVEQQQALEEERQKKTDERQNALIAKLQENQEAITDKSDDQEAAMTQALLTQQQQLLPLLQTPQQPALATATETRAATPTTPRQPIIDINLDAGLDLTLLQRTGYPKLSTLVASKLEELETLDKKVLADLQNLSVKEEVQLSQRRISRI